MKKKLLFSTAAFLTVAPLSSVHAETVHTVQTGETLFSLSQKYKVSVSQLMSWNNLKSNSIYTGEVLSVSNPQSSSQGITGIQTYYVKKGDTLWSIATTYKTTVQQLMSLNKMSTSTVFIGQKLVVSQTNVSPTNPTSPSTSTQTYTVKAGDTLFSISRTYNVTVNNIMSWNNLKSSALYVGQKLTLNSSSTSPSTPTTPTTPSKVYATVAATSLNLRTSPNGSVITTMPQGAKVEILQTSNGWNQVKYGNYTGWASISYLKLVVNGDSTPTTPTTPPPTTTVNYAYVTASALNMRTSPNGSVVTVLPNGAKVQVISTSGNWSNVKYGSYSGWVSSDYLSANSGGSPVNSSGEIVVLDPGHGGADAGAVNGSYYEKNLTYTLASKAKQYLENMGYRVYLTRTSSGSCLPVYTLTPDLQCRVDKAKSYDADAFVSIHINAAVPGAIGTESYYNANSSYDGSMNKQPSNSKVLAQTVHSYFQPQMGSTDRGVHDSSLYVLRKNTVPATLIEIGFISDYRDLNKMINTTYQNNISNGIARGINAYFAKVN
ncbi:LysM peptidoglycan-binding domain-containing protein [Priestia megaterium]|uniref:LysM peptidoglycan-binding domain-containing protein n=1 Tax=Priestia megaterium TaxID=1404 RepID=UPI002E1C3E90|nr:LysM peptidoglycan-binding domain-containing protein [Priestia megaterium]